MGSQGHAKQVCADQVWAGRATGPAPLPSLQLGSRQDGRTRSPESLLFGSGHLAGTLSDTPGLEISPYFCPEMSASVCQTPVFSLPACLPAFLLSALEHSSVQSQLLGVVREPAGDRTLGGTQHSALAPFPCQTDPDPGVSGGRLLLGLGSQPSDGTGRGPRGLPWVYTLLSWVWPPCSVSSHPF